MKDASTLSKKEEFVGVTGAVTKETSWDIQRVNSVCDNAMIKSSQEVDWGDTSHAGPICLKEGVYQFIVYDSVGDGACDYYGCGHYSVTSYYGELIAQGRDFGYTETTICSLLLTPASSATPSFSQTPSSSVHPSLSPSLSMEPLRLHQRQQTQSQNRIGANANFWNSTRTTDNSVSNRIDTTSNQIIISNSNVRVGVG